MARIPLTSGFTIIPEGHYTFKITEAKYDEDFGQMDIKMQATTGEKHSERYTLITSDGSVNEVASGILSNLARAALQLPDDAEDFDEQDLVGCMIEADIEHSQVQSKKTGRMNTYAHLRDVKPVGVEEAPTDAPSYNLADLLG